MLEVFDVPALVVADVPLRRRLLIELMREAVSLAVVDCC
jgi:hypothetical protein